MVFDDAAGGGSYNGVMAGNVSYHAAYRRTFETSLRTRETRHCQRCGKGKSNDQFAHVSFHWRRYRENPPEPKKLQAAMSRRLGFLTAVSTRACRKCQRAGARLARGQCV